MKEDGKTVTFAPLPTIIPIPGASDGTPSVQPGCKANLHAPPITPFKIYCANFTSFNRAAQNNIFTKNCQAFCGLEHHKPVSELKHIFSKKGCRVSATPPEPTSNPVLCQNNRSKGHGGEFVATLNHIDSKSLDSDIYDAIESATNTPCRFAACIVRFKGMSILLASLYLWDSEGLSSKNNQLLTQLYILTTIIKFPFICFGDFNMPAETFQDSDWPNRPKAPVFTPNV